MTQYHQFYEVPHRVDASSICQRIYGTARIGLAATDSTLNLDLSKGGYCELFEVIAQLAFDLGEMIEHIARENKLGIHADKPEVGTVAVPDQSA